LSSIELSLQQKWIYTLPEPQDLESSDNVTLSHSQLPPFMTYDIFNNSFSLSPSTSAHKGTYPVTLTLSDFYGATSNKYSFEIRVIESWKDLESRTPKKYNRKKLIKEIDGDEGNLNQQISQ
jgi:hypothetical protein